MSANEMTSKIRELKELKAMADELAAEITAIEDSIKAEMTARNTEEMTVDVYKIHWTKVLSNRFDSSVFKKSYAGVSRTVYQADGEPPLLCRLKAIRGGDGGQAPLSHSL